RVVSAAFSPDGKWIVTASWDATARIWDAVTGKEVRVLRGHRCSLRSASFSTDGRRVLTVSSGKVWRTNLPTRHSRGQALEIDPALPVGGMSDVRSGIGAQPGASSQFVVEEVFARLWDAQSGKELAALRTPGPHDLFSLTSVTLSPNGQHILVTLHEKSS